MTPTTNPLLPNFRNVCESSHKSRTSATFSQLVREHKMQLVRFTPNIGLYNILLIYTHTYIQ